MQQALDLARKGEGRTSPNPPVGAVVVSGAEVIGTGFHPAAGEPHAEIFALNAAGDRTDGADLYVTLEPCNHHGRTGPCTEAIIKAGIRRVFVGCSDPNPVVAGKGIERLRSFGVKVVAGLLESSCRRLIAPFKKHILTGLPFVTLKTAMTLDGQTATHTGDSQWVTGELSRLYVHRMRNRSDAILTGIGSILADDSRLTTRLPEGGRDALRIVVDSQLRIPARAQILSPDTARLPLIATTSAAHNSRIEELHDIGVEVILLDSDPDGRVSLIDLMRYLGQRNIQSLLLEAGSVLNGAALRSGIVDRVAFFIAPKLLGGEDGFPVFSGGGVTLLKDAVVLQDIRSCSFGNDILIEGEVV
ncbi:MAG: bifunctional diaminohydroxyphosphoribosylaminopyrimidine deaminase/5-amino-6-(5-phosphoribosylamino)uracil reductase RibD [Desulfuromonadales bacterium]|nr:bifunctional diaminohydroxyphosphoribosylaminopyrimidine deaminase/5-amino-6-(5-phosphoribosylamino)uracil reductase RibD [Desulfuromonadales bacterium]